MADKFPLRVRTLLAHRAGLLCSNPECRKLCRGPSRTDPDDQVNVGCAAHITAASPGGPRYDPNLTKKERTSAANGLWLCRNCGEQIDDDEEAFPAPLLRLWKATAESFAEGNLGKPPWEWAGAPDRPKPVLEWAGGECALEVFRRGEPDRARGHRPREFTEEQLSQILLDSDRRRALEYNERVQEWERRWQDANDQFERWQMVDEYGVEAQLVLANIGRAVLEGPVVYVDFPEGFTLYEQTDVPKEPSWPVPPKRPHVLPGDPAPRGLAGFMAARADLANSLARPDLLSNLPILTRERLYIDTLRVEDHHRVQASLRRLRHGAEYMFDEAIVIVPPAAAGSYAVQYEIHADNLPEPVVGELAIEVVPAPTPPDGSGA